MDQPTDQPNDQRAQVTRLFDQVADTYDAVDVDFIGPIAAGLVDALDPRPGERAVDLGCGKGAVLFALQERIGDGGSVTGIDLSPRMVELTQAEAVRRDVPVELRVGDVTAPGLSPASVDVIASSLVLFFLPDPAAALVTWRGLLVDGGRVGVSTFGPYDEQWVETVDAALDAHTPPSLADARTTGRAGPFASDEGMEQLLAGAGFRSVHTETVTVRPRFEDPDHWYRWSMSVGQRRFWAAIPETEYDNVRAAVLAAVDRCRDDDGRIGFDQQVRYTLGVR